MYMTKEEHVCILKQSYTYIKDNNYIWIQECVLTLIFAIMHSRSQSLQNLDSQSILLAS